MSDRTLAPSAVPFVPFEIATPETFTDPLGASLPGVVTELLAQASQRTGATIAAMIRLGETQPGGSGTVIATWPSEATIPNEGWAEIESVVISGDGIGAVRDSELTRLVYAFELSQGQCALMVLDCPGDPFERFARLELAAQLRAAAPLVACADHIDRMNSSVDDDDAVVSVPHFAGEVTYYQNMVSRSAVMAELFEQIDRVKDGKLSTIVTGETGTGKELVARAIHFAGVRASSPFEVVACGSVPNTLLESELFGHRKGAFSGAEHDQVGVFERANGGTVFLDEIADMSTEMQQKILRVLQEERVRPVGAAEPISIDVRIVSSSRHDVMDLVRSGQFREDLYYRLNVMTLEVPPLRTRREDIPLLLDHFLCNLNDDEGTQKRFADSAVRELLQYSWPGNVQELRNVTTRAFLSTTGRTISKKAVTPLLSHEVTSSFVSEDLYQEGERLHFRIPLKQGFNEIVAECEKLVIIHALKANRGNKSRVTQQLGIPRQTLYNKLDKLGISEEDYAVQD